MALRPLLSLGVGSMAQVFLAIDGAGHLFAVKLAHAETAATPGLRALFLAEAAAARALDHPRLVRCFASSIQPLAMVLQYVDGIALDDLAFAAPPTHEVAVAIFRAVAAGLGALATAGRCHGDLCPRNLLVDRSGETFLTDFGAADHPEHGAHFLGTVGYAAPEIVRGQRPDSCGDAFALGVMLWEALRSERRFDPSLPEPMRLVASAETPLPPVDRDRPALAAFAPLCAALTHPEPTKRLCDWAEIDKQLSFLPGADPAMVGAWVCLAGREELARRDVARNAVAARNGDG
jgi:eukaryotic-like serine/threonine-protein kinase